MVTQFANLLAWN